MKLALDTRTNTVSEVTKYEPHHRSLEHVKVPADAKLHGDRKRWQEHGAMFEAHTDGTLYVNGTKAGKWHGSF